MNLLKVYRVLSGLTQFQLAERSGIDQAEISKIERGLVNPTESRKDIISKALHIKPELIFPKPEEQIGKR